MVPYEIKVKKCFLSGTFVRLTGKVCSYLNSNNGMRQNCGLSLCFLYVFISGLSQRKGL